MADIKRIEIANENLFDGREKRSVSLTLRDDGSIQMYTSDDSQTAKETWGREDYDFWTTVASDTASLLAFELLRQRFEGRPGATDELKELCQAKSIPCEWDHYP
jgi:hypothetical protein